MAKSPFRVLYQVRGEIREDVFSALNDAIRDYNRKLELDRQQIFDDRFVLRIEDADQVRIPVEDM